MNPALAYALQLARENRGPVDMYAKLMEQDEKLVQAGFPPMSPWWKKVLKRFYRAGRDRGVLRLVLRVGRRGGKSSTLCRVAVCEVLHGNHPVPPGDVGVFAFVSVKKPEALERLATVCEILDALGVEYTQSGPEVRPEGMRRCFRVYAASYRTSVGFTGIGLVFDEVARWRDDKTGANPATEILRSMRPTISTMPHACEFMSSSPFSTLDAHYDASEQGDTAEQHVAFAPTWVANPTLTKERCQKLEQDEATFNREYGAIPMAGGLAMFFDHREIEAAVFQDLQLGPDYEPGDIITAGGDFGFVRDSSGLVTMRRRGERRRVTGLLELKPGDTALKPSETVAEFAQVLQLHGISGVMADGHYRESIIEHLQEHQLGFLSAPTDVPATYVHLRTLLHQGLLELPQHKQLIRDLKEVQGRPTATGRLQIILPKRAGGGHADLTSALVLAAYQRAGTVVEQVQQLPDGWTQAELDDVAALVQRRKQQRGEGGLFSSGSVFSG